MKKDLRSALFGLIPIAVLIWMAGLASSPALSGSPAAKTGTQQVDPDRNIVAIPILQYGAGTGTVDSNGVMTREDPALGQSDRGVVPLGDQNSALLYPEEFMHRFTDFVLPGIGEMDVVWTRTYRSRLNYEGSLGYGWTHTYNEFLEVNGSEVRYYDSGATIQTFFGSGSSYFPGQMKLVQEADGSFTLTSPKGMVRAFGIPNRGGISRLQAIRDRNGVEIRFTYNAAGRLKKIIDTLNRQTVITYFSTGRIKQVKDPSGRTWRYGYTSSNNLKLVTTPAPNTYSQLLGAKRDQVKAANIEIIDPVLITPGNTTTYFWDANHNMKRAKYPMGNRFKNVYGANGELVSHERGPGSWSFTYTEDTFNDIKTVDVTDRNGNLSHHQMWMGQFSGGITTGHLIQIELEMNRGIHPTLPTTTSYTTLYDNQGTNSIKTFADGQTAVRMYDLYNPNALAHGNIKELRRQSSQFGDTDQVHWYIYESRYNQVKRSVGPRAFPTGNPPLIYNNGEWILDVNDPLVQQYQIVRYFDYEEVLNGVDYNGDGILGPEQGNLVKTVYPTSSNVPSLSQRKVIYNAWGMGLEVIDANGYRTRYFYWPVGDPFGLDPTSPPVSDFSTPVGLLAKIVKDYSEDPTTIDPLTGRPYLNLCETQRYDDLGNVIQKTDPKGFVTPFVYNTLNQLEKEIKPAPFLHEIRYQYNANGLKSQTLIQNVDANGVLDTANPWIAEKLSYDLIGNVTKVENEKAEGVFKLTRYYYDKNENLALKLSPKASSGQDSSGVESYVYDERDQIYSWTRGGFTSQFQSTAAHDHLNLGVIGVSSGTDVSTATYGYDAVGTLTEVLLPNGNNLVIQTDGFSRKQEVIEPKNNKTRYDYNLTNDVISIQTFDASNNLLSDESRLFDERRRLIETSRVYFRRQGVVAVPIYTDGDADGIVIKHYYHDAGGRLLLTADDRGLGTFNQYDGAGRKILENQPAGNQIEYSYDPNGNQIATIYHETENGQPKTLTHTFDYDTLNRLITHTDELNGTYSYAYNSQNRISTLTDPLGNAVTRTFGAGGLLTETKELHEGGTGAGALLGTVQTARVYDDNGNLIEYSDGEGRKVLMAYDSLDRKKQIQIGDPGAGPVDQVSMTYYLDGEVDQISDPNGNVLKHFYDNNGWLSGVTVTTLGGGVDPLVTNAQYQYNDQGLLAYADNGVCQILREYDSLGNLVEETLFIDGFSFNTEIERDGSGNLLAVHYPSGLTALSTPVSDRDQIYEIQLNTALATYFRFTYEGISRIVRRETFSPNTGASWQSILAYDGNNRLETLQHGSTGFETLPDYQFHRNAAGLKTAIQRNDLGLGNQHEFDSTYQVTQVKKGVPVSELLDPATTQYQSLFSFLYDLAKNRLQVDEDGNITGYSINHLNQVTSVNGQSLSYDGNGNLIDDGQRVYVYDYGNRMRKVIAGGNTVAEYFYDPLGRRVKKVAANNTSYEIWFDARLVQNYGEIAPGAWRTWEYIYGRQLDDTLMVRYDGNAYFVIRDDLGSATHLLDEQGALVESYQYDPFGFPTIRDLAGNLLGDSTIAGATLFTGRSWNAEVGLYNYRARYYSPSLGRFNQPGSCRPCRRFQPLFLCFQQSTDRGRSHGHNRFPILPRPGRSQ